MARSKIHVGLEIGTSKTCLVVGEVKADSAVKILGIGVTKTAFFYLCATATASATTAGSVP